MALSDYQPERREIRVNGKPLCTVEGLSLEKLALLVKTHLPDLEGVMDILATGEQPGEDMIKGFQRMALALANQAPGLVANIMAVAAGEYSEEGVNAARRLPFPVKVQALVDIAELTFEEAGGVKKSIESLVVLFARMRAAGASTQESPDSSASTSESDET